MRAISAEEMSVRRIFSSSAGVHHLGLRLGPQTMTRDTWSKYLAPASEALTRLVIASDFLLDDEQRRTALSDEARMELEVPRDSEAQS
jgi:hypothetical protein